MSLAFRSAGLPTEPLLGALPPDLAFLRDYGVAADILYAAWFEARLQDVEPIEALIAGGAVTDTLVYQSLARHIGVPFRQDWSVVAPRANHLADLRAGRVILADGTALFAPSAVEIRVLLRAARKRRAMPRRIAIATPAHCEALVLRRAGVVLAQRASLALPTLEPRLSARGAFGPSAWFVAAGTLILVTALLYAAPAALAVPTSLLFLAAITFRIMVCASGVAASPEPLPVLRPEVALPHYSVLVPLRHEAGMVGDLIRHLATLDYPAAKLEILLLVEADDAETLAALASALKPAFMRTLIVPPGEPRTKPRALNLGLALARGDLITVFDAEDRPEPDQLRKAAAHYAVAPGDVVCLQARLAISDGNLLQRLFALEYAALFDVYNVGLAQLGLPLPLGGTSNHFRASALRDVGGWDAWNVTEDADLGLRLARFGYRVDVLPSTTWEEAPPRLATWTRQRRRWTKGWMQVTLVLSRDPATIRDLTPIGAASVALMLIGLLVGPLATPPVLCLFAWQVYGGGLGLAGWPATLAAAVPLVAIAATLWCGWAGLRARSLGKFAQALPLLLPYQLLIALAAWGGLWDLVRRPYHWRKTPHGADALARPSSYRSASNRSWPAKRPRQRTGLRPARPD